MSKWLAGAWIVAALLAAWITTPGCRTRGPPRRTARTARAGPRRTRSPSSAVAKWVIAPASSKRRPALDHGFRDAPAPRPASRVPRRPIPVSSLTCILTGSPRRGTDARRRTARSRPRARRRAASATASSSELIAPITRIGAPTPPARSSAASSARRHRQQRRASGQRSARRRRPRRDRSHRP